MKTPKLIILCGRKIVQTHNIIRLKLQVRKEGGPAEVREGGLNDVREEGPLRLGKGTP